MLASLGTVVNRINRWLLFIAAGAMAVIILATVVETGGRLSNWVFGAIDVSQVLLAAMVFLMLGYTQAVKQHISIDLIYSRLPHRVKLIVDMVMSCVALCISVLITWKAVPYFLKSMAVGGWTQSLHIPLWPFQSLIVVGGVMLCLQFVIDIIDSYQQLRMSTDGNGV